MFNKINYNYIENTTYNEFKQFLLTMVSEEDTLILQEFLGFCLVKEYFLQKSLIFLGGGSNGKLVLITIIKRLFGKENITAFSIGNLTIGDEKYTTSELHNKLVNLAGDIPNKTLSNDSIFKTLTGEDELNANRKYKNSIGFVNYAKFINSFNDLPMTYDHSDGFFKRWLFVEFTFKFISKIDYDKLGSDIDKSIKLGNPKVAKQFFNDISMEGILKFAIDGLVRLNKNNKFSDNNLTQEIKGKWLRTSNSLQAFFEDKFEKDLNSHFTKEEFRVLYYDYCNTHNLRPVSNIIISRTMIDNMVVGSQVMNGGISEYQWIGLKLK
jgi:putative DNA primase/helicase